MSHHLDLVARPQQERVRLKKVVDIRQVIKLVNDVPQIGCALFAPIIGKAGAPFGGVLPALS
jgi:hypothetical protein